MPRIFVYDGREFDDPDPDRSVEEVRHYLTHFYGDLRRPTATYGDLRRPTATMEGWKGRRASLVFCQPGSDGEAAFPAGGKVGRLLEAPGLQVLRGLIRRDRRHRTPPEAAGASAASTFVRKEG